jgi:hypothetical protein
VHSTTGAKVRLYAIALPFTSNRMKQWLDKANFFRVRHSIDTLFKRTLRGLEWRERGVDCHIEPRGAAAFRGSQRKCREGTVTTRSAHGCSHCNWSVRSV